MTRDELKDIGSRAGWTAAQSFLAVWVVSDIATLKVALVAALAAGVSSLKTFVASRVRSA